MKIKIWPGALGPSKPVRRGVVSMVPKNLEANREGEKSAWCKGPSRPDEEAKRDRYLTSSVTENGHLPYKMALVMLTILPEIRNRRYQLQLYINFLAFLDVLKYHLVWLGIKWLNSYRSFEYYWVALHENQVPSGPRKFCFLDILPN